MRKSILKCSMPGCSCWASTPQVFALHMKKSHGVTIDWRDLVKSPKNTVSTKRKEYNIAEMQALRASGKTLQEIADRYNITREWVRQLMNGVGQAKPLKPYLPWPDCPIKREAFRIHFYKRMKVWLWSSGYRRCATCKMWDCTVTVGSRRCKECRRLHTRAMYRKDPAKFKSYKDPVKVRAANKRFRERNPGKSTAYNLARYHRVMQTPEGREKMRANGKAQYQRRKERSKSVNNQSKDFPVTESS